jgi:S-methylmethionine-dependent homocysteine/selenocysteine methylase
MARFNTPLPQQQGGLFLTDGGLETTLVFHEGIDLPGFAAFDLLKDEAGVTILKNYFDRYARLAKQYGVGLILESPTWRANPDWSQYIGYSDEELQEFNRKSIELMQQLAGKYAGAGTPVVISACIGPRYDGYRPERIMSAEEAEAYHLPQIRVYAETGADLVSAFTMTNVEESVGITNAARTCDIPVVISFTVETDGRIPTGQTLKEAIEAVDRETDNGPAYYMINCAHPSHFEAVLNTDEDWVRRILAIRANASRRSHAELDEAEELDTGNPQELADDYRRLLEKLGHVTVLGGCCGTDHRHVDEIFRLCA